MFRLDEKFDDIVSFTFAAFSHPTKRKMDASRQLRGMEVSLLTGMCVNYNREGRFQRAQTGGKQKDG